MKQYFVLIAMALVIATSLALWALDPDPEYRATGGVGLEVVNTTLNASTYVAIIFTNDTKSILCKSRTGMDIYAASSASPSTYFTISEGTVLGLDRATKGGGNAIFLKASSGTPVAECIGLR
jgi:hypothetical protein